MSTIFEFIGLCVVFTIPCMILLNFLLDYILTTWEVARTIGEFYIYRDEFMEWRKHSNELPTEDDNTYH